MNVTIIGAGLMGSGIAQVFLAAGHEVVLHDSSKTVLEDARQRIAEICSLLQAEPNLSNLTLDSSLAHSVKTADLIIEAIVEDLEIKRELFERISRSSSEDTILATNTSAIPISKIAASISNPARFVGTHFWNPPWAVDLVEVVQGDETSADTVRRMMLLLSDLCMEPVHVRHDIPGFLGNRLQHALKREAIALVERGICDAETVDTVVKSGFGARLAALGPLEQSDLVGLDLTLRIHETLIPDLDRTPGPAPLLKQKVAEGKTGMKSGTGFRDWTPESAARVRQRLNDALAASGRARIQRLDAMQSTEVDRSHR